VRKIGVFTAAASEQRLHVAENASGFQALEKPTSLCHNTLIVRTSTGGFQFCGRNHLFLDHLSKQAVLAPH
jgi:hypothetical protein